MRSREMVWAVTALLAASGGHAQMAVEATPATTEGALHGMAQQAAVIFAGQVVAVRRVGGRDGATGVVEILFAVDDGVRGVSGNSYTLREWAGLWAGGEQPLRAGQRYLMLLYAPSAAGLSSPVGGADGAIPIRGEPALAEPGRGPHGVGQTVDLRWVATRVARAVACGTVAHPTALPVAVHAEVFGARPAEEVEARDAGQSGDAVVPAGAAIASGAQDAGYATVMALLRSWAGVDDAAR